MKLSRRKLFGAIAVAPFVGVAAVKAAAEPSVAQECEELLSLIKRSFPSEFMSCWKTPYDPIGKRFADIASKKPTP
jgi:hypothetical protein